MKSKVKYIHTEMVHNTKAPSIIVPLILQYVSPKSVVDFGCGLGTWIKIFKDNGAEEILGLDGEWCNTGLLFKNINEHEFKYVDLEKEIKLSRKFDLVISLEVAEHISEESADIFVQSLVDAGKIILFSAAIPGQGGFNHVNEQWPSYWMKKFQNHGYYFHDVIRNKIWNNPELAYYYKQNMFIIAHESVENTWNEDDTNKISDIVHPGCFESKCKIERGERGVTCYLKLLPKSIIHRIKTLI